MAGTRGVGEIIDVTPLEHKRSLENILQFRIGDKPFLRKELVGRDGMRSILTPTTCIASNGLLATQLCHPTAKTLVDAPSSEIEILLPVIIAEELRIKSDDVMHITVGNHHRILLSKNVVPRTNGRLAFSHIDVAGFTVVVAESAVSLLYHIWSPNHLGCRPVHDNVLPVAKILRHPNLCRTVAVARAVGGGIQIISVAKLTYGGVSKISWNKRIASSRGIPLSFAW